MSYNEKVLQYFKEPKNYGRIEDADGVGKIGNAVCGDVMYLYIKIDKTQKEEVIEDIKFETFGCVAAIATSGMITDMAKGKTLKEAMAIKKDDIVESLEGLPPSKIHCSVLASGALSEAIYDYLSKNNREIPEKLQQEHQRLNREKEAMMEKYKEKIESHEEK